MEKFGVQASEVEMPSSQFERIKDHDPVNLMELLEIISLSHGLQHSVKHAEGFRSEAKSSTHPMISVNGQHRI